MKSKRTPTLDLETLMPLLIGVWRRFHKISGPQDRLQTREFRSVVEAVKILQSQHDGKKSLVGLDYFADRELLGAYLLYQWVVHYQEAMSLLGEVPHAPKRVLDLCSGPGAFAFAALRYGASEVIAIDRNLTALEVAGEITGRYGMPLSIRKADVTIGQIPVEGKFDVIILGHALNELFPTLQKGWQERQQKYINRLLQLLTPHGNLLLVENSFTEDNRRLLTLRDQLVDAGVAIQAPCVWKGECPTLKSTGSFCYAQRDMQKPHLLKEIQRAASINLSSLKMTYLLVRSPEAKWPEQPEKPLYRVVSPPVENYRGKRFYLCGTDGKKNLGSHFKEQPAETRAFDYLKRGELISISGALQQRDALDLIEGSSLTVEAAIGKPLP